MSETAKRRRLRRRAISGAVEAWLPPELTGADAVRAEVVRRLALELDARDLAPHAVPRLANSLVAVLAVVEDQTAGRDPTAEARRLLAEVFHD